MREIHVTVFYQGQVHVARIRDGMFDERTLCGIKEPYLPRMFLAQQGADYEAAAKCRQCVELERIYLEHKILEQRRSKRFRRRTIDREEAEI